MIWCVTYNPALDVAYRLPAALRPGAIQQASGMEARAGGKGNNVARTVMALGGRAVTGVMPLGGEVGEAIRRSLHGLGVRVLSTEIPGATRVCVTVVHGDEVTEVRAPGPTVSREALDLLLAHLLGEVGHKDWVTLSGSLPPAIEPDVVRQWVSQLRGRVAGVIADLAPAALLEAVLGGASAVVPNQSEYEAVRPRLERLSYAGHVIVTRGREGANWRPPGARWRRLPAAVVEPVNPVGAGDAFLGGLVHGLSGGYEFADAIRWAQAVAAASTETLGVADVEPARARDLMRSLD
jgi:tagatose 6-phosphate kinase